MGSDSTNDLRGAFSTTETAGKHISPSLQVTSLSHPTRRRRQCAEIFMRKRFQSTVPDKKQHTLTYTSEEEGVRISSRAWDESLTCHIHTMPRSSVVWPRRCSAVRAGLSFRLCALRRFRREQLLGLQIGLSTAPRDESKAWTEQMCPSHAGGPS